MLAVIDCGVNNSQNPWLENPTLDDTPFSIPFLLVAILALAAGGCAVQPESNQTDTSGPVPDITLNLPGQACQCEQQSRGPDGTFLDRGFEAMHTGDYNESVENFQRHQRLEKSDQSDWEAELALVFMSTLPDSPTFDPEQARKTYRELSKSRDDQWQLHPQVALVSEAMDMFLEEKRYSRQLEVRVEELEADLLKKDEAIKRLRELTLGQGAM